MNILYKESPTMFKSSPVAFIISILLIPVLIGIIILLSWRITSKSTILTIDETDVHYQKGLLNKKHIDISIEAIKTVRVYQTFFNRILGVGTVEFYTAGDNIPEISISGIPNPHEIRTIIKNQQIKINKR